MKSALTVIMVCLICLSGIPVLAAADETVTVAPAAITGTLKPGETQDAQITVTLPGSVPKGDVVFAFDTTGSMGYILDAMKFQGTEVMMDIRAAISDTRFGAASFMDYPKAYADYYGYTANYGEPQYGDYDFLRDQDLTSDIAEVSAAINQIPAGSGGDWPQDYARVIYEARDFSWRADAKKIYVIFGDAPPHAAPGGSTLVKPWGTGKLFTRADPPQAPYGGDPGRDGEPLTPDDLDYATVVQETADAHIVLVGVYCPNNGMLDELHADAENNFRYMAYMTGGLFVVSNPNGDASEIAAQMVSMIQEMAEQNIKALSLQVEETDYRGWLSSPDAFTDVTWPSTEIFHVTITPPPSARAGVHTFHIDVTGDGVVLGTVTVTVQMASGQVEEPKPKKVSIDIKPGSCPNSFNIKEKGVLPVAILGDGSLKVSAIDPKSIVLMRDGGTDGVRPIRSSIEDVGSPSTKTCSCGLVSGREDRKPDLTLKFDSQDLVEKLKITKGEGCVKVTITGTLRSSDPKVPGKVITGSDYLRVLDTGKGTCGGDDKSGGKGSCDGKGSSGDKGSCDGKGSSGDKGSCDNKGSCGDNGPPDDQSNHDGKGSPPNNKR
jgi:hypothetical protein